MKLDHKWQVFFVSSIWRLWSRRCVVILVVRMKLYFCFYGRLFSQLSLMMPPSRMLLEIFCAISFLVFLVLKPLSLLTSSSLLFTYYLAKKNKPPPDIFHECVSSRIATYPQPSQPRHLPWRRPWWISKLVWFRISKAKTPEEKINGRNEQ